MEKEAERFNSLYRFLKRQETMYGIALRELNMGKKMSHWMWYIFPQIRGLAKSRKAFVFGIKDINEAKAYLAHPLLGPRLIDCCKAILKHKNKTAKEILGNIDAVKLRSSMTLFAAVSEENSLFHKVLEFFYDGETDPLTEGFISGRMLDTTPLKYLSDFID